MKPVLKTNNVVLISFARDLLAQSGIDSIVFDENASIMDGSLGIVPRRLMVADEDFTKSAALLKDGLAKVGDAAPAPREVSEDRFQGGRIVVRQFKDGFRAGLDAVMLAAAVPARGADAVLELGSGAGTASLCLAARVDGVHITGVEIDRDLVTLANANATANGMGDRVVFVAVDVLDLPPDMKRGYNHVLCNPPFHAQSGERSPDAERARATHDEGDLGNWLAAGLKRTASGGIFTAILRADRLAEALAALPPTGVSVFPLHPRAGEPAKRVIVQAAKGSRAPLAMLHGLVLHEADGRYTAEADAVLRGQRGLLL
jgi:tRNA1Val (adenine37-N6)-methyltransferase